MLWSQFSGIFANFRRKILEFFSKTNVMINFFQNLTLFWVKNTNFFAKFFGENIFKIITSVPAVLGIPCHQKKYNFSSTVVRWAQKKQGETSNYLGANTRYKSPLSVNLGAFGVQNSLKFAICNPWLGNNAWFSYNTRFRNGNGNVPVILLT
jgi:hypothetical protein